MTYVIFYECVDFLEWLARLTGTTYEEINVLIFCCLWPLLTMALAAACLHMSCRLKQLKKEKPE
jgi:hypothetical protein